MVLLEDYKQYLKITMTELKLEGKSCININY